MREGEKAGFAGVARLTAAGRLRAAAPDERLHLACPHEYPGR